MAKQGTVAVVGLGRFGTSIANRLVRRGAEVVAVDISEHVVQRMADELPQIVCADGTDVVALQQAGISATTTTHAVVAIGSRLEASMMCTLALTELAIPSIWAAASSPRHARILQSLGAHQVPLPAHEAAHQIAANLTRSGRWRMWYSSNDFSVATVAGAPDLPAGFSVAGLPPDVVAAVKTGGHLTLWRAGDPVQPGSTIIVAGQASLVFSLLQGGE